MVVEHRRYMDGDYDSSLLMYLRAAHMGYEVAELNAAWLLQKGLAGAILEQPDTPSSVADNSASEAHVTPSPPSQLDSQHNNAARWQGLGLESEFSEELELDSKSNQAERQEVSTRVENGEVEAHEMGQTVKISVSEAVSSVSKTDESAELDEKEDVLVRPEVGVKSGDAAWGQSFDLSTSQSTSIETETVPTTTAAAGDAQIQPEQDATTDGLFASASSLGAASSDMATDATLEGSEKIHGGGQGPLSQADSKGVNAAMPQRAGQLAVALWARAARQGNVQVGSCHLDCDDICPPSGQVSMLVFCKWMEQSDLKRFDGSVVYFFHSKCAALLRNVRQTVNIFFP